MANLQGIAGPAWWPESYGWAGCFAVMNINISINGYFSGHEKRAYVSPSLTDDIYLNLQKKAREDTLFSVVIWITAGYMVATPISRPLGRYE